MFKNYATISSEFNKYLVNYDECYSDISFMNSCITEYKRELNAILPNQDEYFASVFTVYNSGPNSDNLLKSHNREYKVSSSIYSSWQEELISNIHILNLVKYYNACERLIIALIRDLYFDNVPADHQLQKKIDLEIKNTGFTNTKNNRHLIDFLADKNILCAEFLNEKINIDRKINWKNFFNLISILRNNIAHNGGYLNSDILNSLKGVDKKLIDSYFITIEEKLKVKNNVQFHNFFNYYDQFVINLVKFACGESDLKFLDLK